MSRGSEPPRPLLRPIGHDAIIERLAQLAANTMPRAHNPAPTQREPDGDLGTAADVAHAWLMVGPEGVGKFHTALWWATRLKCTAPRGDRAAVAGPCGCPSCRQIAALSHPDLRVVEPPAPGKAIGIEEVRELIHAMALKPRDPGPKIAIVREAQLLTTHAQSAMLKLLEEPPGFSVIVLVSENLASLLPTIRSRCQTLRFSPLAEDAITRLLIDRGRAPQFANVAAALSQGSAGRACDLTPETIADRTELLLSFERFHAGHAPLIEVFVDELLSRRKDARHGLEALYEWQMRKVEAALGCGNAGESGTLAEILASTAPDDLSTLLEEARRIHATLDALERNANASLAVRDLLLDLRPS